MRFVAWHRQTLFLAACALGVLSLDAFVDDTDLSIVYAPANQWVQGATCGSSCAIQPDAPSVHDGTWHYATYDPTQDVTPPSITYKFTATTIAVRNILPPLVPTAPTSHVELAFELDGVDQPGFSYSPTGDSVFTYGGVVMSVGNLALEEHTLVISVPPGQAAVVLFDCFELTVPDPPSQAPALPSSSQSSSATSEATPSSTTTTSSQSSSHQATTTSSTTSTTSSLSGPSSTSQSSLHASAMAATSSGDGNGASNTQLLPGTSSAGAASNGTLAGTATTSPGSSGTSAPQSQSASSSDSSSVKSAAIGGAVGGGALLIVLLAAFCVLRVRRARRHRTSVGNEAPSRDWETTGGADDSPAQIEQFPYRDVGPTVVHRLRLQGSPAAEDPFADGSDYVGLLAPTTAPPGDMTTHRGVEMSGSNLFAGTAASLDARPPSPMRGSPPHRPASLHRWNTGEKASMANNVAHASPRPPLVSVRSDSETASLVHTESSSQALVDSSPGLGEQLVEQLVALREEVAQMRQHREEAVLLEAPPRYDEA
ncbi:hypothetical protein TRAPUB_4813 [Trametes pubescens]|uniref:Uncharacterized protein n=1 Tax=Trametes pubescens TaxID=154538 RepID=A0A1M2VAK0_TRAPU|nr:hypothetical protein TRAPUB_4813 [Trametes pubescens]